MKKIVFIISAAFLLNSCVVSTAAKVVKGAVNVSYKAVKGTVNGISWAVSKAKGKIDEDRIDGTWKVVGVYQVLLKILQKIKIRKATLQQNVRMTVSIRLFSIPESQNLNRYTAVRIKKSGRNILWNLEKSCDQRKRKLYRVQFQ